MTREEVRLRTISTCWVINKLTRGITSVSQVDQIDTFVPKENGQLLEARSSVANYDQNGTFLQRIEVSWTDHLLEPYHPIDIYQGVDIRQAFAEFLVANGFQDRVPSAYRDNQATPVYRPQDQAQEQPPVQQPQSDR